MPAMADQDADETKETLSQKNDDFFAGMPRSHMSDEEESKQIATSQTGKNPNEVENNQSGRGKKDAVVNAKQILADVQMALKQGIIVDQVKPDQYEQLFPGHEQPTIEVKSGGVVEIPGQLNLQEYETKDVKNVEDDETSRGGLHRDVNVKSADAGVDSDEPEKKKRKNELVGAGLTSKFKIRPT